jgi:hypothetical protein
MPRKGTRHAREHPRAGPRVGMRRAVGVAFEVDRRYVDAGRLGRTALQPVVLLPAVAYKAPEMVEVCPGRLRG